MHHIPGGVFGSLSKQRDVVGNGDLDPAQQRSTGSGIREEDRGHQTVENMVESEVIAPIHLQEAAVRLLGIFEIRHFQGMSL